jgi:dynein heavy chain
VPPFRQRRKYASKEIEKLLAEISLNLDDIMPAGPFQALNGSRHTIALEYFDNTEFDCRTPADWIALGPVHGVPAKALVDTLERPTTPSTASSSLYAKFGFAWTEGLVRSYEAGKALYTFQATTTDGSVREIALPRILILFRGEDPTVYVTRLKDACARREQTESALLSQLYIDCMPLDCSPRLEADVKQRLAALAARKKPGNLSE